MKDYNTNKRIKYIKSLQDKVTLEDFFAGIAGLVAVVIWAILINFMF